jgi:tetratricopeptide (TPR) repeat protein
VSQEKSTISERPSRQVYLVLLLVITIGIALWINLQTRQDSRTDDLLAKAMSEKRYDEAELLCRKLLDSSPRSASLLLILGECAQRGNRVEEAIQTYRNIPKENSREASIGLWASGEILLDQGKLTESIQSMTESVSLDQANTLAKTRLASLLNQSGQRWEAIPLLLDLIGTDQWTFETIRNLGNPLRTMQDVELLTKCLELQPNDVAAQIGMARALVDANKMAEAENLLDAALRTNPASIEAYVQLGKLYLATDPSRLAEWERRLPNSSEWHPDVWYLRGEALRLGKDWNASVRCYAEALKIDPDHAPALLGISKSLGVLGDKAKATELGLRARKIEELTFNIEQANTLRKKIDPHFIIIERLTELGRINEALAWFQYGTKLEPNASPWQNLASRIYPLVSEMVPGQRHTKGLDLKNELSFAWKSHRVTGSVDSNPNSLSKLPSTSHPRSTSNISFESVKAFDFRYFCNLGDSTKGHLMHQINGGGIGVLDFDRDGWPDLFLSQGTVLNSQSHSSHSDKLFRNRGQSQLSSPSFLDVTEQSGIQEYGFGQGVAIGDVNSDGFDDIYVGNIGPNQLWLNQGDGTWSNGNAIISSNGDWTTSVGIVDLNSDGTAELLDANYVQGLDVYSKMCDSSGLPRACSPLNFRPTPCRIHSLNPDHKYLDISRQLLPNEVVDGNSLGMLVFRFNVNSALPSIFLGNDMLANNLFVANLAPKTTHGYMYADEAIPRGIAFDASGRAQACMGIAAGDVDSDGSTDILVTNFYQEYNTLYLQNGDGLFDDRTKAAGLVESSMAKLGFGAQLFDADCNGTKDLVVLNGHIDDLTHLGLPYRMVPQFFVGNGQGGFHELSDDRLGDFFKRPALGRSLCLIDANRDGNMDFVAGDLESPTELVINRTQGGKFAVVRLVGTVSHRDAIGAILTVTTTNSKQTQQLFGGSGYMVSNERCLHFGFSSGDAILSLEVNWPSGISQRFDNLPMNQSWLIIENSSIWQQ